MQKNLNMLTQATEAILSPLALGIETSRKRVESPLLCRKEAATYLNVAAQTLAQWATNKKEQLPVVKVGRKAMYRKVDLDAFITANCSMGNFSAQPTNS